MLLNTEVVSIANVADLIATVTKNQIEIQLFKGKHDEAFGYMLTASALSPLWWLLEYQRPEVSQPS